MRISQKISPYVPKFVLAIIIVLTLLQWVQNRQVMLHDWDESIYAQVAREWKASPSIVATYNGEPWLEKPPLPYMVIASLTSVFGESELVERAPSVALYIVMLVLVYKYSTRFKALNIVTTLSLLALATSPLIRDRSQLVNVDIYLAVGWLGYIYYIDHPRKKVFFLLLGTLSKSALGLLPVCIEFVYRLIRRELSRNMALQLLGMTILSLSWHLIAFALYGQRFVQEHLLDHLVARVTRVIELHFGGRLFYADVLYRDLEGILVAAVICILVVCRYIFLQIRAGHGIKSLLDRNRLIFVVPIVYFIFLTFTRSKLHWYVTPIIPFVCLWFAYVSSLSLKLTTPLGKIFTVLTSITLVTMMSVLLLLHITQSSEKYIANELQTLALCLKSQDKGPVSVLVNEQARRDRNVIEAAQLQIGSSFRYGGMPSFLYYANRPITFNYKLEEVVSKIDFIDTLVVHDDDVAPLIAGLTEKENSSLSFSSGCESGSWRTFVRQED